MFYFNANNSRSFIFYCIVTFFTIILYHTSYIRKPQIISGGGRCVPPVLLPKIRP